LCCQEFAGVYRIETNKPSTASPHFALLQPFNCFSETVAAALKAAESLSDKIRPGFKTGEGEFGARYTEGTHVLGSLSNTSFSKYTGPNGSRATQNYLNSTQGRVSNALAKARPGGIEVHSDLEAVTQWRLAIQAGISAIQTEPQGDPEKVQPAFQVLQRSLLRADSFLRELNALGSRLNARR
jgi:hypothetical protein